MEAGREAIARRARLAWVDRLAAKNFISISQPMGATRTITIRDKNALTLVVLNDLAVEFPSEVLCAKLMLLDLEAQ